MRDVRQGLTEKLDGCRDELRACIARSHQDLLELIRANHAQMLTLHEHLIERIEVRGLEEDAPRAGLNRRLVSHARTGPGGDEEDAGGMTSGVIDAARAHS